jgi:formylglycine-generating enzyme
VFEKVLRSFETGGFTYPYVLAELKRLLLAGASPTELLEVLRRRQLVEPLPQDAYLEVFNLLDAAEARVAEEKAISAQARSADADTPPDKVPEPVPAPVEPTSVAPRLWRHENPEKPVSDPLTSVFARVLNIFEASGFTNTDVLSQLKRLLIATGASPKALLAILRRRQLIEPLPEHAHMKLLWLLNEVIESTEGQNKEPDVAAQSQGPLHSVPTRIPAPTQILPAARTTLTPTVPVAPIARSTAEERAAAATPPAPTSNRSPAELRASAATPTPTVTPDSVVFKAGTALPVVEQAATTTPAAPTQAITSRPPPPATPTVTPDSVLSKAGTAPPVVAQAATTPAAPTQTITSRPAPPAAPTVTSDSVLSKAGTAPPAVSQAATTPPAAPTQTITSRAAPPAAPTLTPDSVLSKAGTAPPVVAQAATTPPAPPTQTITSRPAPPPASTWSRSPAELRASAATPTPTVTPDSAAARADATPPANDLVKAKETTQPVAVPTPAPGPAPLAFTSNRSPAEERAGTAPPAVSQAATTPPAPPTQTITSRPAPPPPSTWSRSPAELRAAAAAAAAAATPTPTVTPNSVAARADATPPTIDLVKAKETPQPVPVPTAAPDSTMPGPNRSPAEVRAAAQQEAAVQPVRLQVPALTPVPSTSRRKPAEEPAALDSQAALRTATQSTISSAPSTPASKPASAEKPPVALPDATQSTISTAPSGATSTGRTFVGQTAEVNATRIQLAESDPAAPEANAPAAAQPTIPSAPPAAKLAQNPLERRRAAVTAARRVLQDWLSGKTRTTTRDSLQATTKSGSATAPRPAPPPTVSATVPEEEVTIDFGEFHRSEAVAKPDVAVPAQSVARDNSAHTLVLRRGPPWRRGSIGLALGAAAVVVFAIVAAVWNSGRHAPVPAPVQAPTLAALPNPGTVIRDCPTCPAMTVLPMGRFQQGSESAAVSFEKPLHWVMINHPLAMSTNTVTVDEFQRFITATGRDMQGCDTYDGTWKRHPKSNWKSPGFPQTGAHPVTCTSWNDAVAYAQWLSKKTGHAYRLPSASEWEYAARAGSLAILPWNADGSGACENANVADESAAHRFPGWSVFGCKDGYVYTAPVGSFKSNAFGLNDMLGNVFQWTKDCWSQNYVGAPIDGSARMDGNCAEHELRGGSWFSTPAYVRANYRNHFAVDYRTSSVGIRLVRDIER